MIQVVLESPFKGTRFYTAAQASAYLDRCILDCLRRGESPYASHAIITRVWDDDDPELRAAGIRAGLAWHICADRIVFYLDLGWSEGMRQARKFALDRGYPIEERRLGALGLQGLGSLEGHVDE